MSKSLRWLMVTIILVTQFIYPVQIIYAIEKSNDFSIQDVDIDNGLFNLVLDNSVDYDEIRVEIPKGESYDLFGVTHKVESHSTITIEKKDVSKNIIPIKLLNSEDNKQTLSFGVYKNNILLDDVKYKSTRLNNTNKVNKESVQRVQDDQSIYDNSNNVTSAPDLQRFLSVIPVFDTVESGNDALYKIILKTTGSQVNYTNVRMVIKLPNNKWTRFQQNLDELAIANIVPLYDEENNQLVYDFDELKSGQTYEIVVKVGTTNGYMKNNDQINLQANLTFLDNDILDLSKEGSIIVKASNATTITKEVIEQKLNGKPSIAMPGVDITWKIKVSIPYKKTGQMFLKEGDKIVIQDILPSGLEFNKALIGGKELKTNISKNKLTWNFDVPSFEEQKSSKDSLFQTEILVYTTIEKNDKLVGKELENKASLDTLFIDEKPLNPKPETSSSITVYKSMGDTANIEGAIIVPAHYGPLDSKGGYATNNELNPNITVDDSAYLGFRHGVRATIYGARQDLNKLDIIYTIDKHLYLDKLILPSDNGWFLGRTKEDGQLELPLAKNPTYKVVLSYVRNGKMDTITLKNLKTNEELSLEDLGLKKGDRVTEVKYVFDSPVPMGFANKQMSRYLFTVEPGYVGEVKNEFNMIGESSYNHETQPPSYSTNNNIAFNHKSDAPEGAKALAAARTAQIVKNKSGESSIANILIELDKQENGIVDVGTNRMKIIYSSPSASTSSISEKLESVVLLPPGVRISEKQNDKYFDNSGESIPGMFKIIDKNYNNTNRQLVKFEWNEKYIRPSQQLSAEVDIDISSKAPNSLYFDVYGFSGNKKLDVPKVNNSSVTDTILQTDIDDLNKDGKKDSPRIKSSNVYHMINMYDLQTEKYIKNNTSDWSKFIEAKPSEVIDYRLYLTNSTGKDISSMTLIDVLPFKGDLGLTDNISRGSQFRPTLVGPVTLPTEWKNKVSVYYSEESQPTRDELYRYTTDKDKLPMVGNLPEFKPAKWLGESAVSDWSKISSIKIELVPGTNWIPGVDMDIIYQMKMPSVDQITNKKILDKTTNPIERAAWNSFAVATDQGQPVEPHQVGVYMNEDIGNLTINKIDSETKKTLSGAEFKISNEDGSFEQTIISNEKGLAKLTNLPLGHYILEEVKAPDGYNLSEKKLTFEVTNETYNHTILVENQKIKGKLTIKKVDSVTGKALSGAVFEVKNSKGEIITTLTTDDKGFADISDLLDDKYTITEVKAPEGYNILQKPIEFEITSKNSDITLTVKNTKTGWELPETGGSGILLSSVIGLMFISVGLSFIRVRKIK